MCGIAGIAAGAGTQLDVATLESMTARLTHRGPDTGAVWHEHHIGLGHRRLAILELSNAGAQPMHSDCGRYVLVFNGEIYNHLNLRRDLESVAEGRTWRGHSDTETLLASIAAWDSMKRFAGRRACLPWVCGIAKTGA